MNELDGIVRAALARALDAIEGNPMLGARLALLLGGRERQPELVREDGTRRAA